MSDSIKNILFINANAVIYGAETRLVDIINSLDQPVTFNFDFDGENLVVSAL